MVDMELVVMMMVVELVVGALVVVIGIGAIDNNAQDTINNFSLYKHMIATIDNFRL